MSYFKDVYLKRINRFGTSLQERILNKKEYDFHYFVDRSPNRVAVYIQDYKFEGVLQTKTYDEIETIDYFLTYKSIYIPNGSVLKVQDIKDKNIYSYWIIVAKDNFVSAGYNRYTVIRLDREIRWITDEGYLFKTLAHITGSGSGGTNKRLNSSIKLMDSVIFKPNQVLTLVVPDHENIKRGVRIHIGDQVWKISGYDNVTNEGVSYITLEQDYHDEQLDDTIHVTPEPPYEEGIAGGMRLERWAFDSNLKETYEDGKAVINLTLGEPVAVDFRASYFEKTSQAPLEIKVTDKTMLRYNRETRELTGLKKGTTSLKVMLQDYPDISQEFIIEISDEGTATDFSVEGAARIKYGIPAIFYSKKEFEIINCPDNIIVRDLGWDEENEPQFYRLEITSSQIVKNLDLFFSAKETGEEYKKTIQVESPWIGG